MAATDQGSERAAQTTEDTGGGAEDTGLPASRAGHTTAVPNAVPHYHAGYNVPGYLPESEPATFAEHDQAKRYLIAELNTVADNLQSWSEEHDCHDIPCPTFGDDCKSQEASRASLEAEDVNLLSDGEESSTVIDGYSFWLTACQEHECVAGLARRVASEWHSGPSSPLYAFASSGAILPGLAEEVDECRQAADTAEQSDVELLAAYVAAIGERGPVSGWGEVWS